MGERAKAWRDKLLRRRPSSMDISQQDSQGNWIPFETGSQAMKPRVGTFSFGILYSDAGKKLCSLSGAACSKCMVGVVCRLGYLPHHRLRTSLTSFTGCRAARIYISRRSSWPCGKLTSVMLISCALSLTLTMLQLQY